MVDPIGFKPAAVADRRLVQAGTVSAPQATAPAAAVAASVAKPAAGEVARSLSSSAPVDADRVARIRKAIEDGSFPIVPATVADRLLAFRMNWNPNDAA
ncbi:flagellar biosynthesis anti-sigma factor FlgM [Sphingomonas canadensis]|uniref:Negative regulator of flagellin synthesis n=1 Tax=Sphingomonas canadensis TaxID=1219257 RepID=A0ABW3H1D8_9SPHN|nr:flagellar biosynthesis anti-sigma factor FlgM [Sphingomonas canadensis]MCW3834837.1 flagellar biosynthesis anti-sigma factor FlgM [Sphingomonas canadensis]